MTADPEIFREALRQTERAVDLSLHAVEEMDDKAEQLITLAVATLGGGLAIVGLLASRGDAPVLVRSVLLAGVAANLGAALTFVRAYVGSQREGPASSGPHPRSLAALASETDLDVERHQATLIEALADAFESNAHALVATGRTIRRGVALLVGAASAYALTGSFFLR